MQKNKVGFLFIFALLLAGCGGNSTSVSSSSSSESNGSSEVSSSSEHIVPSTSDYTILSHYQDPNADAYYSSIADFDTLEGQDLADALRARNEQDFTGVTYAEATQYIAECDKVTVNGIDYVRGIYTRHLIPLANRQIDPTDPAQIENYWNKEHSFPQSKLADGDDNYRASNTVANLASDFANIFAADDVTNTQRSNYSYTEIPDSIHNYLKDSFGNDTDMKFFTTGVQPTPLARGEVARANLYMLMMYPDRCGITENGYIGVFLKWNLEYPPTYERDYVRNSVVYRVQHDRNPFIDDNTLACRIWGGTDSYTQSLCSSSED